MCIFYTLSNSIACMVQLHASRTFVSKWQLCLCAMALSDWNGLVAGRPREFDMTDLLQRNQKNFKSLMMESCLGMDHGAPNARKTEPMEGPNRRVDLEAPSPSMHEQAHGQAFEVDREHENASNTVKITEDDVVSGCLVMA